MVDVDGTLLDNTRLVTPRVREVVDAARQAGVRLTLATGRVFCSAVQIARELGIDEPIISDGGAVLRYLDGREMRDLRLEPGDAAEILAAVADEDADIHAFYRNDIVVNRLSPTVLRYASRLRIEMAQRDDMAADARGRSEGPTMIVLRSDRRTAPVMRAKYGPLFGPQVQVTSTAPHFVDFLHQEAGKDRALAYLCDRLGIPLASVIAIGDGINDLDMISRAGLGVLVGNAAPELWRHADYVAQARYSEGIAEVIERFCLK